MLRAVPAALFLGLLSVPVAEGQAVDGGSPLKYVTLTNYNDGNCSSAHEASTTVYPTRLAACEPTDDGPAIGVPAVQFHKFTTEGTLLGGAGGETYKQRFYGDSGCINSPVSGATIDTAYAAMLKNQLDHQLTSGDLGSVLNTSQLQAMADAISVEVAYGVEMETGWINGECNSLATFSCNSTIFAAVFMELGHNQTNAEQLAANMVADLPCCMSWKGSVSDTDPRGPTPKSSSARYSFSGAAVLAGAAAIPYILL